MVNREKITQLTQQLIKDLPAHLMPFREEIAGHFKVALQRIFSKLDLVTREEFDVQVKVLQAACEKLAYLENKLKEQT